MDTPIPIVLISLLLSSLPLFSISSPHDTLPTYSSLFVSDVLISPNGIFSAGFHSVGENAYCFSIWFTEPTSDGNLTAVWMANRDQPVNGKRSKLSLLKSGNLILTDAAQFTVWSTNTKSISPLQLQLLNTGNLVLRNPSGSMNVWESFDSPTDTLLPNQPITRNSRLVSSRSHNNFSSGFYSLFFDDGNLLRLAFDGPEISIVYWPDPGVISWDAGRTSYDSSRIAAFNSSGYFRSSDDFEFKASDYGIGAWRILKMDVDGNVRLYSLDEEKRIWSVSWQAMSQPCKIHAVCGPNAMCNYDYPGENAGRRCSCLPGLFYKFWPTLRSSTSLATLPNPVSSNFLTSNFTATISNSMKITPVKDVRKYAYKAVIATASISNFATKMVITIVIRSFGCLTDIDALHLGILWLSYLHEECLEWVLHCDVKPQNILLDSNFQPKVADFGLSKLVNRGGGGKNSRFSRVRGMRGYMAPEWISNLRISSKVDVYSYRVVVMEMVTGKSPMTMGGQGSGNTGEMEQRGLVKWVREKMNGTRENELWLEEIIDPVMKGKCVFKEDGDIGSSGIRMFGGRQRCKTNHETSYREASTPLK
ncbi:hypothetical protein RHGRI_016371 [Rhododendron griersonianum]|uniref:Non-specific serine/threonine protein kinase n=1 Tax=Rhododendron griersonianum TaxID=479676 RepID=A0AAV6JTW8_9ERIC|nr:hypothetical protein RHGRI_016371 [Rhododendron griersonianum]